MRYGIGLDLFQRVNGLSEAMEQAKMWANELISSSLLLKGDSNAEVKIHDLVRAFAISFIDKGKERMTLAESIPRWMCKETFKKFTAISLMSGHDFSRLSGVKAPLLEILLLKGDVSLTTLASDFFEGMKNLKVLSLSNVNFNMGLPESMAELERLQTLHLHHCKLKDVKLIGKLVNLLVLSLRESSLEELPIEIGELCNLRLLDIEGCKGMKRIPANILSRLSLLEGLYMFNSFDDWASTNIKVKDGGGSNQASGSELDTLSHLNVLEMEVSQNEQLLTVNSGQLAEQLGKFKIRVQSSHESPEGLQEFRYVLELIDIDSSPNSGLRALLKKTECLVLIDSYSFNKNVVPELDDDGFKDLKYLKIQNCEVKFLISSNEQNESMAFAYLEILELIYMNNLEMICDGKASVGIFSNLRRLNLYDLHNLECGLSLTSALLNLNEVSVDSCQSLKFVAYKDAKTETEVDMFTCLKSLQLRSVNSLSSVLRQSGNEMFALFNAESKYPSLENLLLTYNDTITTLWSRTSYISSFQGLKIEFPRIEELDVQEVSNEVLRLWNWSSSLVQGESESGGISLNPIPNLQILRLAKVHGLASVPHSVRLSHLDVNEFDNIKSLFSVSAVNGEAFCTYSQFPYFKNLSVRECRSLEQLFDSEDDDVVSLCERLIGITLHNVPKLKILPLHLLKNIRTLSICKLSWKFVFPADLFIKGKEQLQLLESLKIENCRNNMEVIIKDELVGDDEESVYSFPRLKILKLEYLNITKFASKPNSGIQFPSLESIELWSCDNIESFWSGSFMAPKLKDVKLHGCDKM
ncbi:putative disease resistance protein At4g27220 [Silene latifolia]|uniref:putative disease resistance protein At4g27220 n=1 Tax=Silene latifolia TaxID=37657 RepID=UPI003D7786B9